MHTRVRSRVASACLCSPNRTLSRCLSSIQVQVDSLGLETMERIVDIFDAQLTDQAAAMEIYDTLSKVLVSLVSSNKTAGPKAAISAVRQALIGGAKLEIVLPPPRAQTKAEVEGTGRSTGFGCGFLTVGARTSVAPVFGAPPSSLWKSKTGCVRACVSRRSRRSRRSAAPPSLMEYQCRCMQPGQTRS